MPDATPPENGTPNTSPPPAIPDAENLDTLLRTQGDAFLKRQGAKLFAYALVGITGFLLKHGMDGSDADALAHAIIIGGVALLAAGWEIFESWAQHKGFAQLSGFLGQAAQKVSQPSTPPPP